MTTERRTTTANTGLAKVAVRCFANTFVVNHPRAGGLRINNYGNKPAHRKSANR